MGQSGELSPARAIGVTLGVTVVAAWFSYGCFHVDEYFQIVELTRSKLVGHPTGVEPSLLTWEASARMRPWLQPFLYWLVARALDVVGVRALFQLTFVFRLLTGLANVAALWLFVRTTLPWQAPDVRRLHLLVVAGAGFLPYLFVRTSSESAATAAFTAGWALLFADAELAGRAARLPRLARPAMLVAVGFLFGLAFELRYQTALLAFGVALWLVLVARARPAALAALAAGGALALALGALVNRWGYGVWVFPAATYVAVNVFHGVASTYGTNPPFAYLWMSPANVFAPVVLALVVLALLGWVRRPWDPLTWTAAPFVVAHCLLAHKEERFLFPVVLFALGLVAPALAEAPSRVAAADRVARRLARWARGRPGRVLAGWSVAWMLLCALVPFGWNHHARFSHYLLGHLGEEVHATVLPETDLNPPVFHPRVYDVEHASAEEVARRLDAGAAGRWLITERGSLAGTPLEGRARLVYCELPTWRAPSLHARALALVDAYNASAPPRLRRLRFRSLYELAPP